MILLRLLDTKYWLLYTFLMSNAGRGVKKEEVGECTMYHVQSTMTLPSEGRQLRSAFCYVESWYFLPACLSADRVLSTTPAYRWQVQISTLFYFSELIFSPMY